MFPQWVLPLRRPDNHQLRTAMVSANFRGYTRPSFGPEEPRGEPVEIATRVEQPGEEAIGAEAKKGYGLLFIGREPASEGDTFHEQITKSAVEFAGPFAIAIARGMDRQETLGAPLRILVPVTGTSVSRQGAELAIALAQASRGSVTALHVASRRRRPRSWQRHLGAALAPTSSADAIIREIVRLGDHYGVAVRGAPRRVQTPQEAILRELEVGGHNLLAMGVSPRPGDQLFFGQVPAELLERAECSVLFVASEPPTPEPEPHQTPRVLEHPAGFVSSAAAI
jgi:nucleotide-binding universal stress UspA family protein